MDLKKLLILGLLVIFVIAGAFFLLSINKEDESKQQNARILTPAPLSSGFVEYSKSAFENASNSRRILFFYANWCPICKPVDKQISENVNKIPKNMTIIRVNFNDTDTDREEKELAKKYLVNYQHTFVQIDENGNFIAKWIGGGLDDILANSR